MENLSNEAKEARRAYQREWYRRNKEKAKQRQRRYWERKAAAAGVDAEVMAGCASIPDTERTPMEI